MVPSAYRATLIEVKELDSFVVWIDVYCGTRLDPDWEQNSDPQSLMTAIREARQCREVGFPACICAKGETPRSDGMMTGPDVPY